MPESIQAIIAARLDALAPAEKHLLQQAAVLGKVFWLGGLIQVSGRTLPEVEAMLHRLDRREFVRRERQSSVATESEYAFRHGLVRDVAYEQLPRAERADRHRRAAEWIDSLGRPEDTSEMLAHHYLLALEYARAAGRAVDDIVEPARAALGNAGERALSLNSPGTAARFYGAALDLTPPDAAERPLLLFGNARALHGAAGAAAIAAAAEACTELARVGDGEHAAEAEVLQAELWWHTGDRVRTEEHLQRAQVLIADAGRTPSRARVLSEISRYHMLAGRNADALAVGRQALELARELNLPAVEAHALDTIGTARLNGGDFGGIGDVEKSLEVALAADVPEAARSYNNLGVAYWMAGDLRRSTEARANARLTDQHYGRTRLARFAEGALMQHDFYFGKWDEFVADTRRFAAESGPTGRTYTEAFHLGEGAIVALARGQDEDAGAMARRALDRARHIGEPQILLPALAAMALIDYELGDRDRARGWIDELTKTVGQTAIVWELVPLTVVALDLGLADQLRKLLPDVNRPSKWIEVMNLALGGEFSSAADLLDEMETPPYAALLRLRAAEQLVASGRRADADEELRRALEFWRSVGAVRYIERAEGLLSKAS